MSKEDGEGIRLPRVHAPHLGLRLLWVSLPLVKVANRILAVFRRTMSSFLVKHMEVIPMIFTANIMVKKGIRPAK